MVGDEGESVVLGETGCNVVFVDVAAVEVDAREVSFAVLVACDHEVVIVWVLVVAAVVGQGCQIVGIFFN